MNQTFGLSWDHGKRKLVAAIALLLIAITLALAPAAATSIEAKRKIEVVVVDDGNVNPAVKTPVFMVQGSTWG